MDAARRVTRFTEEEYLARENASATKHEYLDGEIFAMAGAKLRHNAIAASASAALLALTRGQPCRTFTGDQRIHVAATGSYFYPDTGVVCGKAEWSAKDEMSLVNPLVLVEVLSPATAAFDRGEKLAQYRAIPSLKEILLVWQSEPRVEHHQRTDGGWLVREHRGTSGAIEIATLDGTIEIADLYAQVDWSEDEPG